MSKRLTMDIAYAVIYFGLVKPAGNVWVVILIYLVY